MKEQHVIVYLTWLGHLNKLLPDQTNNYKLTLWSSSPCFLSKIIRLTENTKQNFIFFWSINLSKRLLGLASSVKEHHILVRGNPGSTPKEEHSNCCTSISFCILAQHSITRWEMNTAASIREKMHFYWMKRIGSGNLNK
jgi:hypothetical protein